MKRYYNKPVHVGLAHAMVARVESFYDIIGMHGLVVDGAKQESEVGHVRNYLEIAPEDCVFLPNEGVWQRKYTDHNGYKTKFLWRVAPDMYCCAGKPYYSPDELQAYQNASETRKVIFDTGKFRVCLILDEFHMSKVPTNWGVDFNYYITVDVDGFEVSRMGAFHRGWKKNLRREILMLQLTDEETLEVEKYA